LISELFCEVFQLGTEAFKIIDFNTKKYYVLFWGDLAAN